jgi:translation initiation factor IF-2
MIALGELNPIESVRARLQEQIGNFLQGRAKLNRLMSNPSLQIKGEAQGLYAVQTALETRLQNEITPKLQAISTGVWSASDILVLGGFTMNIVQQINNVGKLERQAGGAPVSMFGEMDMTTVAVGGVIVLGLGILSGVLFGRKTTV